MINYGYGRIKNIVFPKNLKKVEQGALGFPIEEYFTDMANFYFKGNTPPKLVKIQDYTAECLPEYIIMYTPKGSYSAYDKWCRKYRVLRDVTIKEYVH